MSQNDFLRATARLVLSMKSSWFSLPTRPGASKENEEQVASQMH